jgi:hypothetical protein
MTFLLVLGKIKVCSGDYGETKWRGINSATYDDSGFILSSAAQMNEFYLEAEGDEAKQYTICHGAFRRKTKVFGAI